MFRQYRTFCTTKIVFKQHPDVKKRLNRVLNNLDEYKTYAEEEASKLQLRMEPTARDHELRAYLQSRINRFLSTEPKNVPRTKPTFILHHPLMFKALGVTRDDLSDKFQVTKEVEKHLKHDHIGKATNVLRLAGPENSTVGMNLILKHLVNSKRLGIARKLKSSFRKWGFKENEYTFASMLSDSQKQHVKVDKGKAKILVREYAEVMAGIEQNDKAKLVISNVTLNHLCVIALDKQLREFFENLKYRDVKTYTIILNAIGRRAKSGLHVPRRFLNSIWNDLSMDKFIELDAPLLKSYIFALLNLDLLEKRIGFDELEALKHPGSAERVEEGDTALSVMEKYFNTSHVKEKDEPTRRPPHLYPMHEAEYDMYLQCLLAEDQSRALVDSFLYVLKNRIFKLDGHHFLTFFSVVGDNGWTKELGTALPAVYESEDADMELPSAEITGHVIETFLNCPPEEINVPQVQEIIARHRSLWKTSMVYVEVLQPLVKLLHRVYGDESVRGKYKSWNSPVDFEKCYLHLVYGARSLAVNMQSYHSTSLCMKTLKEMEDLFELVKANFQQVDAPFFEEALQRIKTLNGHMEGQTIFKNGLLIEFEEGFADQLIQMGKFTKDRNRDFKDNKEKKKANKKRAKAMVKNYHVFEPFSRFKKNIEISQGT